MNYIDKEKLIKADIASIENRVRHAFNQGYELGLKDGKERAEPLQQEPILDKIRAEIMSKDGLEEALEIIDKYKAESEEP